jgi:hypothetical protein
MKCIICKVGETRPADLAARSGAQVDVRDFVEAVT